jgi:DNA-binding GntR family transcriptional regulator
MNRPKFAAASSRSAPSAGKAAVPSTADVLRSEEAYEQLKTDIVACVLRPGESLTEKQIGDRYLIRKATIRSALTRLMQEGLVKSEPRRGYVIAPLTLRDVDEIFDVRRLIEPEVFRAAASGLTERGLEDVRQAAKKALKPETLRSHVALMAADRAFRLALGKSTIGASSGSDSRPVGAGSPSRIQIARLHPADRQSAKGTGPRL